MERHMDEDRYLEEVYGDDPDATMSENDLRVFREKTAELVSHLQEVQEKLRECAQELKDISNEDPAHAGWATAYIISHLEILAGGEHEWMSYDQSIDHWVKMLEEEVMEACDDDAGEPESQDDSWMQS